MDNGKARVYLMDGVPVIEIYHNDEVDSSDIYWMHRCILKLPINPLSNVIVDRAGNYSLTPDAILALREVMNDHNKVAYVLHHPAQQHVVNYAAKSYLTGHDVKQFQTLIEAYEWLEGNSI